jgi:ABC-type hemin transport system ATPase subunit
MADWDKTGTGNVTHNANVFAAELTKQIAYKAAGNNQASVKAADIAYHRAVLASARAQGIGFAVNMQALVELGTGGV